MSSWAFWREKNLTHIWLLQFVLYTVHPGGQYVNEINI